MGRVDCLQNKVCCHALVVRLLLCGGKALVLHPVLHLRSIDKRSMHVLGHADMDVSHITDYAYVWCTTANTRIYPIHIHVATMALNTSHCSRSLQQRLHDITPQLINSDS
jgi:hypothetical protein